MDKVTVNENHDQKHHCGHEHKKLKSKSKADKAMHKLMNMEYSGISGIKRLKSKHQQTKERDEKEIQFLMDDSGNIKVPQTHSSTVFDLTHGHNDVHEPNDESILSVASNLNRELRFSKNPHFNK